MDIHNIDEYLDLQDQNQMNLLATEELTTQPQEETEWHSATAVVLDDLLKNNENPYLFNVQQSTEWLHEGMNLTPIAGNGLVSSNQDNFITPDSLLKQQPPVVVEEKRVTRSRAVPTAAPPPPKKKKKAAAKPKLYCICQKPASRKPMVQCDACEEWFHCACVGFDPDEQEDEDIDWLCKNCLQAAKPVVESPPLKVTITIPAPVRQTRGASQTQCLYEACHNRTRADSYCSDVCARKSSAPVPAKGDTPAVKDSHAEELPAEEESPAQELPVKEEEPSVENKAEESPQRVTRLSRMRTASMSVSTDAATAPLVRRSSAPPVNKKKPEKSPTPEEEEIEEEEDEEEIMSPSQMTQQENPVRRNVIKNMSAILKTILDSASEDNPEILENSSSVEKAESLAQSIESTMLVELGKCGEPYKSKFRSLLYNLKDKQNQVFQLRVITGDLSPMQLVKMSSEDMANPELKSMSEVLRKAGLKNSVMKMDNTPIIKKTHKGDIIMVPNKDNDTNQNMYSEQVEHLQTTVAARPVEEVKTINSFSPTTTTGAKLDPLDDILARIGIPPAHDETNKRTSSDAITIDYPKKRKVTLDVEELLGEEEDTPFQVEEVELHQPDSGPQDTDMLQEEQEKEEEKKASIWQGKVNMPAVAEFEASARQIGGRVLTDEEWAEVLSPTMWIEGRIPAERVTSYVTQSQYSTSREIVLLEIEPNTKTAGDATQSQTLLKYLHSRQRYAVVGHNKTKVKDFYLIPLYKVQHIPDCLYVVRVEETQRDCDLFLGVLVLTKQQPPVVTKPVYSTPMAAPMYLASPSASQFETPSQPSYYQPPPVQEQQQQQQQQQQQPKYGYGHAAPQDSLVHPSRQHKNDYQQGRPYYNRDNYRPSY